MKLTKFHKVIEAEPVIESHTGTELNWILTFSPRIVKGKVVAKAATSQKSQATSRPKFILWSLECPCGGGYRVFHEPCANNRIRHLEIPLTSLLIPERNLARLNSTNASFDTKWNSSEINLIFKLIKELMANTFKPKVDFFGTIADFSYQKQTISWAVHNE